MNIETRIINHYQNSKIISSTKRITNVRKPPIYYNPFGTMKQDNKAGRSKGSAVNFN